MTTIFANCKYIGFFKKLKGMLFSFYKPNVFQHHMRMLLKNILKFKL